MAKKQEKNVKDQKLNDIENIEVDVRVSDFCEKLDLEILHNNSKKVMHIATFNISRPGLQLAGYYEHFSAERVQIIGEQEISYLNHMTPTQRMDTLDRFFQCDIPCLILTTLIEPTPEIIECAIKYDRPLLRSKLRTTFFVNELSIYLNEVLAPTITIHGVLIDIYGVGVLLIGNSSIGKSETALELVQRNHRLVADDAVCIKKVSDKLVGSSPAVIRHFMEVRGIGIIDIRSMYGAGAVKNSKVIELVVQLEAWDEDTEYDRLGDNKLTYTILGTELPRHVIPVKPGRNLAVILEVAARNYRLQSMGYDTLQELYTRMASDLNPKG